MRQLTLRSYLTAGIAVAGAGIVAVTPVTLPPLSSAGSPAVTLATSYADLFTNTMDNLQNISQNADWSAISQVLTALFANPLGVIGAVTDLTPTLDTDTTSLPATVSVQVPPVFALLIAGLGSHAATSNAIQGVIADLGDPATAFTALFNAAATVLDAYFNGQDNLSLLGGIINVPVFSGILAPAQNLAVDLNLSKLLDILGLGNMDLGNVNLEDLIEQLSLGNLTLGDLLSELGISGDGLGDLLKLSSNITDLGGLLDFLGLGDFGLGSFGLNSILSGLGMGTSVDLNSLGLGDVLSAFGINTEIHFGLGQLLPDLGWGGLINDNLVSLLSSIGLLTPILSVLDSAIASIFGAIPGVGSLLGSFINNLLGSGDLEAALNAITVGGILQAVGFADSTGDLTLGDLLGSLLGGGSGLGDSLLGLDVTGLLNGLDLGGLVSGLGLDNLPLNPGDVPVELSNLNLGELLNDLGLGNLVLAGVSVGSFGGVITELFDSVPQQILAGLGG